MFKNHKSPLRGLLKSEGNMLKNCMEAVPTRNFRQVSFNTEFCSISDANLEMR